MNQGEENRFDGLLRNKFDNFEQDPSPKVWDAVSTKIPSATPKRGILAIRPFLAGMALGMVTMFGAGSAYLSLTQDDKAILATETLVNQNPEQSKQSNNTLSRQERAWENSGDLMAQNQVSTPNPATGLPQHESQINDHDISVTETQAKTVRRKSVAKLIPVIIPAPQIKFLAEPAEFASANQTGSIAQSGHKKNQAAKTNYATRPGTFNSESVDGAGPETSKPNSTTGNNSDQQLSDLAQQNVNNAGAAEKSLISNVESAWLTGLELDTTISQELKNAPEGAAKQEQLHNLLKAQATVLALLQNRNDSLVLALNQPGADSLAQRARIVRQPPAKSGGSVRPPAWPFPSQWALAVIAETTPGWGNIEHGADLTAAQENTSRSISQQVRVMHRLNSRLSVSAGVGLTQLHSSLRYSKHVQSQNDTLINNIIVVNKETWSVDQTLRPNYNFITVPLALHQKFGGTGRLSIGLTAGAQVSYFKGGNKPVWEADRYQLQKVTKENSPFRPFNASLHSSLDLSLRISPKMNLTASPTMRWWALSPLKEAKAAYNLIPGLQVGMIWDL